MLKAITVLQLDDVASVIEHLDTLIPFLTAVSKPFIRDRARIGFKVILIDRP
jgi:hypothetical protein